MKKIFASIIFLLNSFVFAQIRIGILNGPSCIPVSNMMENIVSIDGEAVEFEKYADAQALLPKLLKGEIDIGFLPPNVAAKVYNSTNGSIVCLAVTGEGNLSLITKDRSIYKLSDLRDKTIYVAGQGATPEYITRYLLSQNVIDAKLDFSIPTAQIAAELIAGKIEYAIVPEPFVSIAKSKNSSVISAIDLQSEFSKAAKKDNYPMTVMVCSKKYSRNHGELVNKLLSEYRTAWSQTITNPRNTASLCEKYNLGLNATVVQSAIPKSNYVYIKAVDAKQKLEQLFQIFMNYDSAAIGGQLPDNEFYY